jgi:NDP-sugar pyrophosphorylase family protein
MLVLLTCFGACEPFGFLTKRLPVAMLPVLNKPIIEYLLEWCAEQGLSDVYVALVEHPRPVRQFLGGGERWGLAIHTWDFREPCSDDELLARMARDHQGPVLLIPAETVIDLDLRALIEFHEHGAHHASHIFARSFREPFEKGAFKAASPPSAQGAQIRDTGIRVVNVPMDGHAPVETFSCDGNWIRVNNPTTLWEANMRTIHGAFPHLLPQTTATDQKKWVGHHCRIDPRSTVESPVFIGNHACISSGAEIKAGSVIGNGVIVDSHAAVESSVIIDHTYLGTHTDVVDRIVSGKFVLNIRTGSTLKVDDPIIVSGLREKILGPAARRVTDKVIALFLLLATCPIWGIKGLIRRVGGKPFFDVRTLTVTDAGEGASTKPSYSRINLLGFNDSNQFISRLPGLWDVITGRLALVGVRPLAEEEMASFAEDWAMLRFEAPEGLFTMLDSLGSEDLDEYEKLVIENYYASTRKLPSDLKILFKSLPRLILS